MTEFLSGVIEENIVSGEYGGNIFDRTLAVRLSNGGLISVFDFHCISTSLPVGETCQLIVEVAVVESMKFVSTSVPSSAQEVTHWSGTIIDTAWRPAPERYRYADESFYKVDYGNRGSWVLIRTPMGDVLMQSQRIKGKMGSDPSIGTSLEWTDPRFYLYAIV